MNTSWDLMLDGQERHLRYDIAFVLCDADYLKAKWNLKGAFILNLLDENLMGVHYGKVFEAHHFLLEPFNEMVSVALQAGLIDVFYRDFYETMLGGQYFERHRKKTGPVVLTFDHLYVGFVVWLICIGVSFAVFCLEFFYFRFDCKRKLDRISTQLINLK